MEKWIKMRMSSLHPNSIGKFNDSNHIENFREEILEIYGIVPYEGETERGWGEEHTITSWTDDRMLKSKDGLPLDIMVYRKGKIFTWEPFVEYLIRSYFFERNKGIANYRFGYIDGRKPHLGSLASIGLLEIGGRPGYTMWQEINRKPIEPLKQEIGVEGQENK